MLDSGGLFRLEGCPGIQIYPDDRVVGGFYLIPSSPRVPDDERGSPQIRLMLYGDQREDGFKISGGLLTLTVSLELTKDENEAVRRGLTEWLKTQFRPSEGESPQPQYLAVDWLDGEVEARLTPEVALQGKPSNMAGNRCALTARLSGEQARSLEEAWERGLPEALIQYKVSCRSVPAGGDFRVRWTQAWTRTGDRTWGSGSVRTESSQAAGRPLGLTLHGDVGLSPETLRKQVSRLGLG